MELRGQARPVPSYDSSRDECNQRMLRLTEGEDKQLAFTGVVAVFTNLADGVAIHPVSDLLKNRLQGWFRHTCFFFD